MTYRGLLLDFGGVLTSSCYGRLAAFCVEAGLPPDAIAAALVPPPRPETVEPAPHARAAGVRTGLLSNSWSGDGYDVYTGYDLAALFDVVVISHQVGLRKPEAPIYRLAPSTLGLAPADCVFVDDTEANVVRACELGMAAVPSTGEAGQLAEVERLTGLAR